MVDPTLRVVIRVLSMCDVCWPAVSAAKEWAEAHGDSFIPFTPCPICMAGLRVAFPDLMVFVGFSRVSRQR